MSFLVTGAAGCIGRALIHRLFENGHHVIGMDLVPQPPGTGGIIWVPCDILNEKSYTRWLTDIDIVVHLAARVHQVSHTPEDAELFWRINQEGSRKIIQAAAMAGVRTFVLVSTVAVLSPPVTGIAGAYAESKRAGEKEALAFRDRMKVILIRPATVYGPHDKGNIAKMIRWIDRGLPPVIGDGKTKKSLVFVRNLTEAIVLLAERGESGRDYVVTDGRDVTINEIVAAICRSLGRKNLWPPIPLPAARAFCAANEWLAKSLRIPRIIGRETIEKLCVDTIFDPGPLFTLGFSPVCSFDDGMEETIQWYKRSAW